MLIYLQKIAKYKHPIFSLIVIAEITDENNGSFNVSLVYTFAVYHQKYIIRKKIQEVRTCVKLFIYDHLCPLYSTFTYVEVFVHQ
jgi:hypothetical protein